MDPFVGQSNLNLSTVVWLYINLIMYISPVSSCCLSICLSFYLSIYLFVGLSICLCVRLFVYRLSTNLSVYLLIYLSLYSYVGLFIFLYFFSGSLCFSFFLYFHFSLFVVRYPYPHVHIAHMYQSIAPWVAHVSQVGCAADHKQIGDVAGGKKDREFCPWFGGRWLAYARHHGTSLTRPAWPKNSSALMWRWKSLNATWLYGFALHQFSCYLISLIIYLSRLAVDFHALFSK